jgi:hypothetical protein
MISDVREAWEDAGVPLIGIIYALQSNVFFILEQTIEFRS